MYITIYITLCTCYMYITNYNYYKVVVITCFPIRHTKLATRDVSIEKPELMLEPDSLNGKLIGMYFIFSTFLLKGIRSLSHINGSKFGL